MATHEELVAKLATAAAGVRGIEPTTISLFSTQATDPSGTVQINYGVKLSTGALWTRSVTLPFAEINRMTEEKLTEMLSSQ